MTSLPEQLMQYQESSIEHSVADWLGTRHILFALPSEMERCAIDPYTSIATLRREATAPDALVMYKREDWYTHDGDQDGFARLTSTVLQQLATHPEQCFEEMAVMFPWEYTSCNANYFNGQLHSVNFTGPLDEVAAVLMSHYGPLPTAVNDAVIHFSARKKAAIHLMLHGRPNERRRATRQMVGLSMDDATSRLFRALDQHGLDSRPETLAIAFLNYAERISRNSLPTR